MPEEKENSQNLTSPELEEEIHVMPEQFRKAKKKIMIIEKGPAEMIVKPRPKKKNFPLYLIWVFFGLLIIILAGLIYFKPKPFLSLLTSQPTPINQPVSPPPTPPAPPTPPPPQIFPETNLRAEWKENEEVISWAELYLPEGSVSFGSEINLTVSDPTLEPQEKYKVIGGVFKISSLVSLLKPVKLSIFYPEKEIEKMWEDDLKIGYRQDNYWILLPTEIDTENNRLTSQLTYLPSQTYAALISQEKISLQPTEYQEVAPGISSSLDTDKDALTDREEEIFRTDKNNSDTDGDSYLDGLEIVNLYSPLSGPGDRLAASDLVRTYTNQTFNYSFFYPTPWLVKVMPETEGKEVMITTARGEFFSLSIQDNPEGLSVVDWYKKQIQGVETDKLKKMVVNGQEAVWSLDGLTLYFGQEDKIFAFTYNVGAEKEASFKSIFLMMIKSFKFIETTRPSEEIPTVNE